MGTSTDFLGLDELQSNLLQLGADADKVENAALLSGASILAKRISSKVIVSNIDELHIRDDIKIGKPKVLSGIRTITVGPGPKTNWRAKFLEWGTSKMQAKPFMEPASQESQGDVLAAMAEVVKAGLAL